MNIFYHNDGIIMMQKAFCNTLRGSFIEDKRIDFPNDSWRIFKMGLIGFRKHQRKWIILHINLYKF